MESSHWPCRPAAQQHPAASAPGRQQARSYLQPLYCSLKELGRLAEHWPAAAGRHGHEAGGWRCGDGQRALGYC